MTTDTDELNPHHPVTHALNKQWHKIVAALMYKANTKHVCITAEDLTNMPDDDICITIEDKPDGIHVRLLTMAEGEMLARRHGGFIH